jgi:hypothetical protein
MPDDFEAHPANISTGANAAEQLYTSSSIARAARQSSISSSKQEGREARWILTYGQDLLTDEQAKNMFPRALGLSRQSRRRP